MKLIAFGANTKSPFGHPHQTLRWAKQQLESHNVRVISASRLYVTEPIPTSVQSYYLNQIIRIETHISPEQFIAIAQKLELQAGRQRKIANAPRPLDIDIIAYDDQIVRTPSLAIPHPRMDTRLFVLKPIQDIAPKWIHPITQEPIAQMISKAPHYFCEAINALPKIMGIVNVTPDSFSDGGLYSNVEDALSRCQSMIEHGADIIDIGGESTRPNAECLLVEEEKKRIIPVLKHIIPLAHKYGRKVSVDTRNAETMEAALALGVDIINDVSALTYDARSLDVVRSSNANVVLMHMRGTPETMQHLAEYKNVVSEVVEYLRDRVEVCYYSGIDKSRIIIDPGLGFAKTAAHNIEVLQSITQLKSIQCPILIGASRKSMIPRIAGDCEVTERLGGSIALALAAYKQGTNYLRVHDVKETMQALMVSGLVTNT